MIYIEQIIGNFKLTIRSKLLPSKWDSVSDLR